MSRGDVPSLVRSRLAAIASGVRFGKFVSVGAIGAVCDTTVLVALTELAGLPKEVSTLVGIETAILVMFTINERWTFASAGEAGRASLLARLKRSHVVRAGGSLTQFLLFVVLVNPLAVTLVAGDLPLYEPLVGAVGVDPAAWADFGVWYIVAKLLSIGIAMTVNYVFESLFTWRVHVE